MQVTGPPARSSPSGSESWGRPPSQGSEAANWTGVSLGLNPLGRTTVVWVDCGRLLLSWGEARGLHSDGLLFPCVPW